MPNKRLPELSLRGRTFLIKTRAFSAAMRHRWRLSHHCNSRYFSIKINGFCRMRKRASAN